jgi:hypothetical protein
VNLNCQFFPKWEIFHVYQAGLAQATVAIDGSASRWRA